MASDIIDKKADEDKLRKVGHFAFICYSQPFKIELKPADAMPNKTELCKNRYGDSGNQKQDGKRIIVFTLDEKKYSDIDTCP